MKIFALFFTFIYISLTTFSQEKFQLVTGFSGSFEKEIISNSASQLYGRIGLDAGVRFNRNNGSLYVLLNYYYSSNVTYNFPYDSIYIDFENKKTKYYDAEGNRIRFAFSSLLRSHFVGVTLKYTFKKERRFVNPFISFQALTEVNSNFENGYLIYRSYIPSYITGQQSSGYGGAFLVSHFYHSTPLASNLLGGIGIKLSQNLSLNIAAGYAFRVMKVKYAEWKENEDVYKKLETIPTENVFSHFLDVQLGLSYDFPLKKTSKTQ